MEDRLRKITELEDSIGVELKEADETDFIKKGEKEQKEALDFYNSCKTMSENSSKKMNEICENLVTVVSKIKPLVIPDESQWRKWTPRDFQKFVIFFCGDCIILFMGWVKVEFLRVCDILFTFVCLDGSETWT